MWDFFIPFPNGKIKNVISDFFIFFIYIVFLFPHSHIPTNNFHHIFRNHFRLIFTSIHDLYKLFSLVCCGTFVGIIPTFCESVPTIRGFLRQNHRYRLCLAAILTKFFLCLSHPGISLTRCSPCLHEEAYSISSNLSLLRS